MPVLGTRGAASIKSFGFAGVGRPAAPTNVTATRTSFAQIIVSWNAAPYDGGSPITSYTVVSSPDNVSKTVSGTTSATMSEGLTLGTTYTFIVYATNALGNSVNSQASNSQKLARAPNAPTGVTATVSNYNTVNVSFTAPTIDGGEPITSYTAYPFINNVIQTSLATSISQAGSGTISVTGLTTGTTYTFKVLATNIIGNGALSTASGSVTPAFPTYTISTNLFTTGGTETTSEGDNVQIRVDANETASAKTVYWRISGTNITTSDFTGITSLTGSLSVASNARSTVSFGIAADSFTEGSETFTFEFFTDSARTISWQTSGIASTTINVNGNPRTIQIGDTSLTPITYSLSGPSSVNEGANANFSVTTTGIGSTTLYWTTLHGTSNSSDLSPNSGSVSISGDSGSFSIYVVADATTEGSEYFYVELRTGSTSGSVVATSNIVYINDTSITPPPTLNASASLNYNYTIFGPNSETKAYYLRINKGSPSVTQNWSVSLGGLVINTGVSSPGTSSGNFNTTSNAFVTFQAPHSATTVTVTVSASGYTSYQESFSVPANSVYSPYNFSRGFPQESGQSGTTLAYAEQIANSVYETISTPYTTTSIGGRTTWYGLGRRIDYGGAAYWGAECVRLGITPSSQQFLNTFFNAVNAAGPGNPDYDAAITSSKSFRYGTGYDKFGDRP